MEKLHWGATAIESGTNEPLHEVAPTKEELDRKLFGRAYAAKFSSVTYYRFRPTTEPTETTNE